MGVMGMVDTVCLTDDQHALEVALLVPSVTTVCADAKEGMKRDTDHAIIVRIPLIEGRKSLFILNRKRSIKFVSKLAFFLL